MEQQPDTVSRGQYDQVVRERDDARLVSEIRRLAASSPRLAVDEALRVAESRVLHGRDPLPDPHDPESLVTWAASLDEVTALLPHKPINAIKALREAGHDRCLDISLRQAKEAVERLRQKRYGT